MEQPGEAVIDQLCMCGCGQKPNEGKRYIRYHARKPKTSARHERRPCGCGCGVLAGPGSTYIRGHWMRRPLAERLDEKVDRSDAEGCWPWRGWRNHKGYGYLRVDGRNVGAHRVMYEWAVGPIPDGLELDHLCGRRDCVRPDHLEPVTHMENMRRMGRNLDGYELLPATRAMVGRVLRERFRSLPGDRVDASVDEITAAVVDALAAAKGA